MLTVLLPPSEGKAPGGRARVPWDPASGPFGMLAERRLAVAEALAALDGGDRRLLGVGGDTLERARDANRSLLGAPTLPAWQRFTGVVWAHVDLDALEPAARRRAVRSIVVVHALGGVSRGDDPLPDFRCKLSVSLAGVARGPLARWWQPAVSEVLDAHLRRRLVVDLLPNEHRAAWRPGPHLDVRRVRFETSGGQVAGHTAKAAKGLLARALLTADDPERALATWRHPQLRAVIERP